MRSAVRRCAPLAFGLACLVIVLTTAVTAGPSVIWGTIQASRSSDPGQEGLWKYCLTINWDTRNFSDKPHALGHLSFVPDLGTCRYVCSSGFFAFRDTVGSSTGDVACTTYYSGELTCKGDPTLPVRAPTLKFEPCKGCEPGLFGTATICFYSELPPQAALTYANALWIKFGPNVAAGTLEGAIPSCANPSPGTEPTSWGSIKSLFH